MLGTPVRSTVLSLSCSTPAACHSCTSTATINDTVYEGRLFGTVRVWTSITHQYLTHLAYAWQHRVISNMSRAIKLHVNLIMGTQTKGTHLGWVAEIFGLVLFVHGDHPSNIFCFHQLQKQKQAISSQSSKLQLPREQHSKYSFSPLFLFLWGLDKIYFQSPSLLFMQTLVHLRKWQYCVKVHFFPRFFYFILMFTKNINLVSQIIRIFHLESTAMRKTADLPDAQMAKINNHQKPPQSLLQKLSVHSVQIFMGSWLEGKSIHKQHTWHESLPRSRLKVVSVSQCTQQRDHSHRLQ